VVGQRGGYGLLAEDRLGSCYGIIERFGHISNPAICL
jgi:hypothetical protein